MGKVYNLKIKSRDADGIDKNERIKKNGNVTNIKEKSKKTKIRLVQIVQ